MTSAIVCTHRNAIGEKRFCRSTYCIYIDIPLLKTNIKLQKYIFPLSSWEWLTCSQQVLLTVLQSIASVVFFSITGIVSHNFSVFNNLFLWNNGGVFDINEITIARSRIKSARHRTVSGLSFTTPAGHRTASADVIIYRRRPAPVQ